MKNNNICPECGGNLKLETIKDKNLSKYMGIKYQYKCEKCKEIFYDTNQVVSKSKSEKFNNKLFYEIVNKYKFSIKELSILFGRHEKVIQKIMNGEKSIDGFIEHNINDYFINNKINEFVEKYKEDIPNDYYYLILNKISLYNYTHM